VPDLAAPMMIADGNSLKHRLLDDFIVSFVNALFRNLNSKIISFFFDVSSHDPE
jgi:hypothetical protein